MLHRIATLVTALVPFLLVPVPAMAQTPPAANGSVLGGPVIPGLCLLSTQAVIANSAIGKAATSRLQQLTGEAQAEIEALRRPVDADLQAFGADTTKATPEQRRVREQALRARFAPIEGKAQQLSREIEATRVKALQRVSAEAQSVIAQTYKAKRCGLLVDRNSVLGGNLVNDLTADVVLGLNGKISTINFNREVLTPSAASLRQ